MQIKRAVGLISIISTLFCFTLTSCDTEPELSSSTQPVSTTATTPKSQQNALYHTITFNTNGGSAVASQQVLHGEKITKPTDPIKSGYHLVDWTYQGESWSFVGHTVTEDMTLNAVWELTVYEITYILNEGYDYTDNPFEYTTVDSVVLEDPYRNGYTFLGWFDESDNLIESIQPGMTGDLVLTGRWNDGNEYTVTLDPNGGTVSDTTIVVQYDHQYSLPIPSRLGYSFDGWYFEGGYSTTKVSNTGKWKNASNKTTGQSSSIKSLMNLITVRMIHPILLRTPLMTA